MQNSSERLESLQQQLQAEALQSLDEEEAREQENERSSREALKDEEATLERKGQLEGEDGETKDEEDQSGNSQALEGEDAGVEELRDEGEEPPFPIPRELVLEAAAARAALDAFNKEVLSHFRAKFSLSEMPQQYEP